MQTQYTVQTVGELESVAKDLLNKLRTESGEQATVVALHGDLGAGKTTFTQLLARELGVSDTVQSPTFVVMKFYETTDDMFARLFHIDAYRIEDSDEMRPLHFAEMLAENNTLICIEWAERIADLLPKDTLHLTFALQGDQRTISIS